MLPPATTASVTSPTTSSTPPHLPTIASELNIPAPPFVVADPIISPTVSELRYSPSPADLVAAEEFERKLYRLVRSSERWCEVDPETPEKSPVEFKMATVHAQWDLIKHGDLSAIEDFICDLHMQYQAGMNLYVKLQGMSAPNARYLHPDQVASALHAVFTITNDLSECMSALQFTAWEKEIYLAGVKQKKGF